MPGTGTLVGTGTSPLSRGFYGPYRPPPRQRQILAMRDARNHDTFVRLDPIPDPERELMHRRSAMLARCDDLILEGVVTDAGESAADLLDEAVAEAGLARFVVVLGASDVRSARAVMRTGRLKD